MKPDMLDFVAPDNGMSKHSIENSITRYSTLLGIDFGLKRIGLAVGQRITGTATPLRTVATPNPLNASILESIIKEWQPDAIVVGYPLHADNSETELCQTIKQFGNILNRHFNLPIIYENEYLSSHEAQVMLKDQRTKGITKRKTPKGNIDKFAAALILQRYLNTQKNNDDKI